MLSIGRPRLVSWMLLIVVGLSALAFGALDETGPQSGAERAAELASTIACPQCTGQPVSDSNATIAAVIRSEIKQQVDGGFTDAQIRQVYIDRYGEWVDLSPTRGGLTGVVWILPFFVIGAAAGALALAFVRWRGPAAQVRASDADRDLVDSVLQGDPPAELE